LRATCVLCSLSPPGVRKRGEVKTGSAAALILAPVAGDLVVALFRSDVTRGFEISPGDRKGSHTTPSAKSNYATKACKAKWCGAVRLEGHALHALQLYVASGAFSA